LTRIFSRAAIAWVLRVTVDTVILFVMSQKLLRYSLSVIWQVMFVMGLTVLSLTAAVLPMATPSKIIFIVLTLFVFTLLTWPYIRHEVGKQAISSIFGSSMKTFEQAQ